MRDSDENSFEPRIEDVGRGLRAMGEGLGFRRGEGHSEEYSKGVGEGEGDGEGEGEFISLGHSRGAWARARDHLVRDVHTDKIIYGGFREGEVGSFARARATETARARATLRVRARDQ